MKRIILLSFLIAVAFLFYNWHYIYQFGYKNFGYLKYNVPIIEIKTKHNYLDSLNRDRNQAISDGWITLGKNDLVPTKIISKEGTINAQYRLKGDYISHLQLDKWSYRLETEDSIRGLQKFSLHHPIMRNNINEIFWQYVCKRESIICLDYDIIQLKINQVSFGLYAIEEHFGKNFCSRKGLTGFVIRFEDKNYWKSKISNPINLKKFKLEDAKIDSYNTSEIKKNPKLWTQHQIIIKDLQKWVNGNQSASKVFNTKKMARYVALADLCSGHHALVWFNMRFYYDPKTKLLEPIAFDGDLSGNIKQPAIIDSKEQTNCDRFHCRLFLDTSFVRAYQLELEKLTSGNYSENIVNDFDLTAKKYQNILNWEFPRYKFKTDFVKNNKNVIQEYLLGTSSNKE